MPGLNYLPHSANYSCGLFLWPEIAGSIDTKLPHYKKTLKKRGEGKIIMSNIAAFVLGAMMAYTPSLIVLAFVLWNTPCIYDEGLQT